MKIMDVQVFTPHEVCAMLGWSRAELLHRLRAGAMFGSRQFSLKGQHPFWVIPRSAVVRELGRAQ